MTRRVVAIGLAVVFALCWAGSATPHESAFAQAGTPESGFTTPDPLDCQVEPRTVDELIAFIPAGAATPAAAAASPTPFVAPEGDPADAATAAGVTATAEELFACYNANDFLRVFALFTDDYLRRAIADEGMTAEGLGYLAANLEARPQEERESVSVREIRILPDGRVGAFLVVRNPAAGADAADFTVFIEDEGRFLIDDVAFLGSDASATPQP